MTTRVSIIGYGEAAQSFVAGGLVATAAFDTDPAKRDGLAARDRLSDVLDGATLILSLVTADQALAAAVNAAQYSITGALYCDMNSVAPQTKLAACAAILAAGGRYVDVAVMAPVEPARLGVPLLVSGPHATDGAAALRALGFSNVGEAGDAVGRASMIKMLRSVMVKGIEALTAEMMLGAAIAGVTDDVLASLGGDWVTKAQYNLERMGTHGLRRAAEMDEAVKTLVALGVEPVMTRGTVVRQRDMAKQYPTTPPRLPSRGPAVAARSGIPDQSRDDKNSSKEAA